MPPFLFRRWLFAALLGFAILTAAAGTRAAEVIPSVPTRYFNDYTLSVKPETADRLNKELEDLEKQSSNQILVVIYSKMQTDSSVEDYCHRIYASWHVGEKGRNNAAVLFVFIQDHHLWIETGRGLEGALPDSVCKDITADEIAPKFKQTPPDYDGGLTAGVESMIKATQGEYKGTGRTVHQEQNPGGGNSGGGLGLGSIIFFLFIAFTLFSMFRGRGGGGGGLGGLGGALLGSTLFGGGGGGGFIGGGGSSSSGESDGGFSAGGGDSGAGGGAGSDW